MTVWSCSRKASDCPQDMYNKIKDMCFWLNMRMSGKNIICDKRKVNKSIFTETKI